MASDIAIYFDGGRMHFLHHLTLMSAVCRGHKVTLYVGSNAQNIPDQVQVKAASEIIDPIRLHALEGARLRSTVFQYEALAVLRDTITLGFDHFLYDTRLEPQNGCLFGWQSDSLVGTGVLALPHDSQTLKLILKEVRSLPPPDAEMGVWGSNLLTSSLQATGEIQAAAPRSAFYPLRPHQVDITLRRQKDIKAVLNAPIRALPAYHEYLLPAMQSDFYGLPRYWSVLGSAIRKNGVTVRNAPAFKDMSPPDRIWNNETQSYSTFDWVVPAAGSAPLPRQTSTQPIKPDSPARSSSQTGSSKTSPSENTEPLKVMVVTTMRNEAPFILEWVAYHRSIGITDFIVYTNDCDDGTVELLDALAERKLITARIENPFRASAAGDWQRAALWDLQENNLADDMDWLIPMDVDEFMNIHVGNGQFSDLVQAMPDADMISMIWKLFGNNLINEFEDRFVTEQFDHAARDDCARPSLAWGFKTAFRPHAVKGVWSVHRPKKIEDAKDRLKWYFGSGKKVEDRFFKGGWRADRKSAGYDLVALNHYSLRSSESYLVKKHRGRVNHTKEDQDIGYFFRMNHNVERETSIQPKLKDARALFEFFMKDETLKTLHQTGVSNHKARIQSLKHDPDYSALYGTITSTLLQIYSRLTPHFGNWIFAVGPKSIPEDYEQWARAMYDGQLDPKDQADPPGLQSSGTILPRPEFLEKLNEVRKTNLPEAKELGPDIFQSEQSDAGSQPS